MQTCALWIALAIAIGSFQAYPVQSAIGLVVIVAIGIWYYLEQKKKTAANRLNFFKTQTALLRDLAEKGFSTDNNSGIALKPGEVIAGHLSKVELVEPRSGGSHYVGNSQGISMPLVGRLRYNYNIQQGALVKDPTVQTVVDTGTATFTNKRIVFAGSLASRDWEFDDFTNVTVGPNGFDAMISVSGRDKTSGLQVADYNQLTPGVLLAIANDYFESGVEAAKKRCLDTAAMYQTVLDNPDSVK